MCRSATNRLVSDADQPTVPRARATAPAVHRYVLTIIEGIGTGVRFDVDALSPSPLLIGKGDLCEIRLGDPTVSRRHASVQVVGERLQLRDLGSTNGTFVDGMAVIDAFISTRKVIVVGGTKLQVDRGEPHHMAIGTARRFGSLLGASQRMRRLHPLCDRLARSDVPVIIEGETGVGKEQLAEALHEMGARGEGPFVVFDCTAVAPSLIESELFGHEAGAFSGAASAHVGVFEQAAGGTLLIDELGDLPLTLQPKLLRVIERRAVKRVGGEHERHVDVRVLAATRRDLDREVQLGRFRDDLFHRLAVARIELPPLRERDGDIALLARHFWVQLGGDPAQLPPSLLAAWQDYAWPGNVRELRNAVARRLALGDLAELPGQETPGRSALHRVGPGGDALEAVLALDLPLTEARQRIVNEFEQRYVARMLDLHGGNMARAAAAAGVARRHFRRLKAKTKKD